MRTLPLLLLAISAVATACVPLRVSSRCRQQTDDCLRNCPQTLSRADDRQLGFVQIDNRTS